MNNTLINNENKLTADISITVLGVIGTIMTTMIYTPQIVKSWHDKKVEISWIMLFFEMISDMIWMLYYYLSDIYLPVLTGTLIFIFATTLCIMKIYFK